MRGTDITIEGLPVATFTFEDLPSWNTLAGMNRYKYGNIAKALRCYGESLAFKFQQGWKWGREYWIDNKIFLLIKIYPYSERVLDIPNVDIKHVSDGFTDAKLWPDDDWAHLPLCMFMWAGINEHGEYVYSKRGKKRLRRQTITKIEVHRIGSFVINGERQRLPKGRIK